MNLVKVATWVQEGYREAYDKEIADDLFIKYVVGYVMRKGKGQLNPLNIEDLVKLETSVPDKRGFVMTCNGANGL